jgi:glycosyltransferase involved in cell wall biosynthesis
MTRPRLSIIVATFNAAGLLPACLASIRAQAFDAWELLVVDGGSSDGTVDLIRQHADIIAYWHSHPDKGIYDAWNQAVAQARGDYVCFLGADDAWSDPAALQAMFDAIAARGHDPDLVSARGRVVAEDGRPLATIGTRWDFRGLRRRMLICHPGSFHHRRLFEALGPFDTQYRIAADYDWMLRLPASTDALFVDRVVLQIRDGGVSRRRRLRTMSEHWHIQARHPRVGKVRATLAYVDRLWRIPVARILGMYY